MSLLTKVIDQVDPQVRKEGGRIRSRGDVRILEHDGDSVSASVFAGKTHGVVLAREKGQVVYLCDCSDYKDTFDPCKHVWATMMEAEAAGYLAGWERGGSVYLISEDEFNEDNDSDLDLDEGEGEELAAGSAPVTAAQKIATRLAQMQPAPPKKQPEPDWRRGFTLLRQSMAKGPSPTPAGNAWPPGKQLLYVIDVQQTLAGDGLTIELMSREPKKDGQFSKPRREALGVEDADRLPDSRDAEVVGLLAGARSDQYSGYYYYGHQRNSRYRLVHSQYAPMVQRMCATGRCFLRIDANHTDLLPIEWEDAHWQFYVKIDRDQTAGRFVIQGELRSGERRLSLQDPVLLLAGGMLFTRTHAARLDHGGAFHWIMMLRGQPTFRVPIKEADELLQQLLTLPQVPKLELPQELNFEHVKLAPKPRLRLRKPKDRGYYYSQKPRLEAELSFDYEGQIIEADDASPGIYQAQARRFVERDWEVERNAAARLRALGFRERKSYYYDDVPKLEITASQLPSVIRVLTFEQWHVEADGQLYRQAGEIRIEVSSGIDWFELHGTADFGGQSIALPELLKSLARGEKTIRLDDGTFGVMPEEWLQKYGLLAGMGETEGDAIKFGKTQVGLLDALLAAQPNVTCDAVFEQARERLRSFAGVNAADPPPTFNGVLRPYQREGLGWLDFLRSFSFGGCLADDMGLGKTVQVLAMLEERRLLRTNTSSNGNGSAKKKGDSHDRPGPTLVVAPRSLIFNWIEEARRFAPQLRVLDHTGTGRAKSADVFANYDLVMTTYGTMRNDIAFLKDFRFDYVVLDEAQAIKNAGSEAAKASRLLAADHRLALSGTPVQNHLGELWSLFEFLNPGMLGSAKVLQLSGSSGRQIDNDTRQLLSKALRPFILRRTKGQVAKELPARVEQTIHCELDTQQRKLYDELKEHYRQSLLTRIAREGMNKSKIQILEALLRLRQAACHPGLIDKTRSDQSSAKLDALLPQIAEVTDGGHKALVFSQFTTFLSIVRSRLDAQKVKYEYLDGRTRDRQAVVDRFQNDESCRLFLISLKAGGVGLNLTAAEYVFLLDPWWNPAVEAQAIDRAHRIGQTRQVFAYRLIAQGTVEEKVLQLQESKRELADAIINADNSVISKLGREDLELLLS
jgi:superfamily II DNA or RNA helicase